MPPRRHLPQKKACDACYGRKIQCSFPSPEGPCDWCIHRKLDCTFNREKPRKKRQSRPNEVQCLHRRIEELEGALARAISAPEPITPAASNTNTPRDRIIASRELNTFDELSTRPHAYTRASTNPSILPTLENTEVPVLANQLGSNWFFNGMSISSEAGRQWISSRTDQKVTAADFCISINEASPFSMLQPSIIPEQFELPDETSTRKILDSWFRSSLGLAIPVLDEDLIDPIIETAYEPVDEIIPSPTHLSSRACVFSALSIACRLEKTGAYDHYVDPDLCTAKAHCLLMNLTGHVSLATLQAVVILQLHRMFVGNWQGAAIFHSIACHMVCSLGGHIDLPESDGVGMTRSERETHHTRRLFWLCYMLDKDISLRTGCPPILTGIYCDLILPGPDSSHFTRNEEDHSFLADPRLSLLKEKVCRQLFSAQASKENDNQLLIHIRQLDEEIEYWRLSNPISFRPALSISQSTSPNTSDLPISHLVRLMSLQLEYHHLMTVIHTTVRKCTADAPDGTRDLHDVVHSSFDLSLEASRSTLWCLKVLIDRIGEEALRFITLYSTTAALSLFLNIIIHPYHSQAPIDLEILMSAANTVRDLPIRSLRPKEIALVQEISGFFMRLVWLGSCAMAKVKRDERQI